MERCKYVRKTMEKLTEGMTTDGYKERIMIAAILADEVCEMYRLTYGSQYGDMIASVSDGYGCFYGKAFTIRTRSSIKTIKPTTSSVRVIKMKDTQFEDMPTEYGSEVERICKFEVLSAVTSGRNLIMLRNEDSHDVDAINIFISSLGWYADHNSHKLIDIDSLKRTLNVLKLAGEPDVTIAKPIDADVVTLITRYFLITLPMFIINEMSDTDARKTNIYHGNTHSVSISRQPAISLFYEAFDNKTNGEKTDGNKKTPDIQLLN